MIGSFSIKGFLTKIKFPLFLLTMVGIGSALMIEIITFCAVGIMYSDMLNMVNGLDHNEKVLRISTAQGIRFIDQAFDAVDEFDPQNAEDSADFYDRRSSVFPRIHIEARGVSYGIYPYGWTFNGIYLIPRDVFSYWKLLDHLEKRGKDLRTRLYDKAYDQAPPGFLGE